MPSAAARFLIGRSFEPGLAVDRQPAAARLVEGRARAAQVRSLAEIPYQRRDALPVAYRVAHRDPEGAGDGVHDGGPAVGGHEEALVAEQGERRLAVARGGDELAYLLRRRAVHAQLRGTQPEHEEGRQQREGSARRGAEDARRALCEGEGPPHIAAELDGAVREESPPERGAGRGQNRGAPRGAGVREERKTVKLAAREEKRGEQQKQEGRPYRAEGPYHRYEQREREDGDGGAPRRLKPARDAPREEEQQRPRKAAHEMRRFEQRELRRAVWRQSDAGGDEQPDARDESTERSRVRQEEAYPPERSCEAPAQLRQKEKRRRQRERHDIVQKAIEQQGAHDMRVAAEGRRQQHESYVESAEAARYLAQRAEQRRKRVGRKER